MQKPDKFIFRYHVSISTYKVLLNSCCHNYDCFPFKAEIRFTQEPGYKKNLPKMEQFHCPGENTVNTSETGPQDLGKTLSFRHFFHLADTWSHITILY